jgi:DNA-binding response OmpR family regulator
MKTKSTPQAARSPAPPARPAPAARGAGREVAPSRVVLCERDPAGATPIYLALQTIGIEPLRCRDPKALLEEAVRHSPDVVICDLAIGSREDIFLLELLRRVAPIVPLILVASEGSLVTQRLVQGLRPMYYMVGPVEGPELREAVEAALARKPRPRG